MGKFTISMVIFHSYVKLPEGRLVWIPQKNGPFDRENGEALIIKSEGGKPLSIQTPIDGWTPFQQEIH